MDPQAYCEQKLAQSGSSFAYSFRFLPAPRRHAITALYAFCREVDDVVDEVTDPAVARMKLAWWRKEIGAVFGGTPQHPVALALTGVVAELRASARAFRRHHRRHGDGPRSESLPGLRDARALLPPSRRCRRTAFGRNIRLRRARHAYLCARARHRVPAHQHHPRRRRRRAARRASICPRTNCARFGVSDADILANATSRAGFAALMAFQVERARTYYAKAFAALPAARPARAASGPDDGRRYIAHCSPRSSATVIVSSTAASRWHRCTRRGSRGKRRGSTDLTEKNCRCRRRVRGLCRGGHARGSRTRGDRVRSCAHAGRPRRAASMRTARQSTTARTSCSARTGRRLTLLRTVHGTGAERELFDRRRLSLEQPGVFRLRDTQFARAVAPRGGAPDDARRGSGAIDCVRSRSCAGCARAGSAVRRNSPLRRCSPISQRPSSPSSGNRCASPH